MPYIGVSPQFGVRRKHTYTATAGQTIFTGAGSEGATLSYTDSNFVDVYQNGVKLGDADYTSTSGTQIVLTQAASVDDLVEIIVFDAFSVADTVSKADGGTFDGNVTMGGTLGVTGNQTNSGNLDVSGTTNLDGSVIINESGASVDFRVESDTDANALVVDASGNRVGIGVAAPASKLEISAGGNSHGLLRLDETDASNLAGYMQFDSNGTNKANIQNANNGGIHINVGTAGSVNFGVLGYTSANALDHYEEGNWTPVLSDGSSTLTIATPTAFFTRIGNSVHAEFYIQRTDSASNTATMILQGLPFAHKNLPAIVGQCWIDNSSSDIRCFLYLPSNYQQLYFVKTGASSSYVSLNEFDNNRYIYAAFDYLV